MSQLRLTPYVIHPLSQSDLAAAASVCAMAMQDNPIHIKVFGARSELRQRRLCRFFPGLLRYVHRKGRLFGAFSGETLIGVIGMLPPGHCRPTPTDLIRLMPALLTSNSITGTVRLARWLGTWASIDPLTPHWHLGPLAIHPTWQNQGIGTHLMKYALDISHSDHHYLETDKLSNVVFYEAFGFSVLAKPSILKTPGWVMMRSPDSSKSGLATSDITKRPKQV